VKSIANLFVYNFWVRNSFLLLIFISVQQLIRPRPNAIDFLLALIVSVGIYVWFIFHNKILLEKYLTKREYLIYFLLLLIGFGYYGLIMSSIDREGFTLQKFFTGLSYAPFNTMYALLLYLAYKYFMEQRSFAENKIYVLEMEQKYLKNQLSPHFLFNTLNNIYSYSLIESKKTPELILKLSELMRYLTQFNKMDKITLREELSFIDNYVAFERERLEDRCEITLNKKISSDSILIEPLLFFPLIENAFKHGTNTMERCYVEINISEINDMLIVEIRNKIYGTKNPSTNSGIENVRKRLELFYNKGHKMEVKNDNGDFVVELQISLNKSISK
jgi:two-component system LytT family sensor kinase